MVNYVSVIYLYLLACCFGGGELRSVDNCIDLVWKEIKSFSVIIDMNFFVIEIVYFFVYSL